MAIVKEVSIGGGKTKSVVPKIVNPPNPTIAQRKSEDVWGTYRPPVKPIYPSPAYGGAAYKSDVLASGGRLVDLTKNDIAKRKSEDQGSMYVAPPTSPAGNKPQQLTLADLGIMPGQQYAYKSYGGGTTDTNLNTLTGGRGWYVPWNYSGVQGTLDWQSGTFYPAYPVLDLGGGDDSGGGGGGYGGGGGGSPRAGGFSMGLVNWRIG